jgi:hypothetical protein
MIGLAAPVIGSRIRARLKRRIFPAISDRPVHNQAPKHAGWKIFK